MRETDIIFCAHNSADIMRTLSDAITRETNPLARQALELTRAILPVFMDWFREHHSASCSQSVQIERTALVADLCATLMLSYTMTFIPAQHRRAALGYLVHETHRRLVDHVHNLPTTH